ncbi:MAG: DUF4105 domain-containing protein [Zhongshania sp.]|uniref:Lnb N-terminal periplasmic domain-containing protein n=1 Tax=Zhongshania sp. TaxID=1971902 RepID=UPI0026205829|nr:DUF4105 domain-containing protein [Zhongshania sp.]MDF1693074.1 DUF4105 domain-containing protein [Zhongshania sp.]
MARSLAAVLALLFSSCVIGAEVKPASNLMVLAQSNAWRALLHIPRGGAEHSYIDDPRFFLAENGPRDRGAELSATLAAFAQAPEVTACRFPARYKWLREQGILPANLLVGCSEYLLWRSQTDIQRVVLVLAASYLNSPSSMYGHTFLRLDPAGARSESAFLSYALNFAASIPAGENGMLYAYRGILGGYPGLFSMQPYYEKIQEYSRLENRDMWEYPLDLSAAQIDTLLAHTWELRGINFDYYYFDENCSFRLLELLEVALPDLDLTSAFARAAMPVDTVRAVIDAGLAGEPEYRPSKRIELELLLKGFDRAQRGLVKALAASSEVLQTAEFKRYPKAQRQTMAMAAYRYLRYTDNREQRRAAVAARSLGLLGEVQRHGAVQWPLSAQPAQPDQGHPTSLFALTLGSRGDRQYSIAEWRISYHDALDSVAGYPEGATLSMGRLQLRWQEGEQRGDDKLQLQRFDPIAIRSLAPRNEFFSPLSWQVDAGVERLEYSPEQSLVTRISGGAGVSVAVLGGLAYALPGLRLEYNDDARRNLRLAPQIALGQLWQSQVMAWELALTYSDFGAEGERRSAALSSNWAMSSSQALRASVDYRNQPWGESTGVEVSWRHYF